MLDLFSGIGGFSLAASWVWGDDLEIVGFCEIDPFCQKILKKHWPEVKIYDDIKELKGGEFGAVDLITGGFPCQPYSIAGKREGEKDNRALWPEMLRVISEIRPSWIIAENVAHIINMGFENMLFDLEATGHETGVFIIPACATGAPHRRNRVWVIANSNRDRSIGRDATEISTRWEMGSLGAKRKIGNVTNTQKPRLERRITTGTDAPMDAIQNTLSAISGKTKLNRGTDPGLKLQPAFALWMMGFPEDWCNLKDGE